MALGGVAPSSRSRITPPPSAATNDMTITPSRSRPPRIALTAPSTANTNVPARSAAQMTVSTFNLVLLIDSVGIALSPLPSFELSKGIAETGQRGKFFQSQVDGLRQTALRLRSASSNAGPRPS